MQVEESQTISVVSLPPSTENSSLQPSIIQQSVTTEENSEAN